MARSPAPLIVLTGLLLTACHTLSPEAQQVVVTDRAADDCANLGHVNIDLTLSGLPSEAVIALRNKAADKGGNTLVMVSEHTGIAYRCPAIS
jgi:hypothetical protein